VRFMALRISLNGHHVVSEIEAKFLAFNELPFSLATCGHSVRLDSIPLSLLIDAIGKDAVKEHFGLVELTEPGAPTSGELWCARETGHFISAGSKECHCGLNRRTP